MTLLQSKLGLPLTPLATKLAARIADKGPISFHDFMAACLYDSEHGYYTNANPIGRGGDFITAPEISQVFGELIGLWAGEVWRQMGRPEPIRLIELGPGRGTLMADALRALRVLPQFLNVGAVECVETSGPLRRMQQAALSAAVCPVSWHGKLEEVPVGPAIVIANEFVDCLPVQHFIFDAAENVWRERFVDFGDGHFRQATGGAGIESPPNNGSDSGRLGPEDGSILEYRPAIAPLIAEFASRAAKAPFVALIIDYGYDRPCLGETVQAVRAHQFVTMFDAPGQTDLTAHADFNDLKQAAVKAGLSAYGPMPMGEWLLRLGLEARAGQLLKSASEEVASSLKSGLSRLVDPSQMGVLFKVLVIAGGVSEPPPPFL